MRTVVSIENYEGSEPTMYIYGTTAPVVRFNGKIFVPDTVDSMKEWREAISGIEVLRVPCLQTLGWGTEQTETVEEILKRMAIEKATAEGFLSTQYLDIVVFQIAVEKAAYVVTMRYTE